MADTHERLSVKCDLEAELEDGVDTDTFEGPELLAPELLELADDEEK